ncbi:MAG: guanylate kinase [Candidatus Zixiibacteriota bacterium]|nr:MAG: guanylate kinase [candidate division Zixibacteria bacterium]
MSAKRKEILVVLSSPSGGGKTTVCQKILKKHKTFVRSVSATTRSRRKGERQGRDYIFLTEEQFRGKIRKRQFVEWAWVHGHRYGTLKESVTKVKKQGKVAFFVLDVQGGMAMKRKYPQSVLIFLLPPSMSELKRRLVQRGTEETSEMKQRLKTGLREMNFWSKYDYVVINKSLSHTVKSVENIIESERLKSSRFDYARWRRGKGVT